MKYLKEKIILGGCLKYKGKNYDVDIDKNKIASVAYAFDTSNELQLTKALEKSVLKIAEQLDNDVLKIHIIDFDVTRKFKNINQLKNIKNLINYVNAGNIRQTLLDIENTLIDYNNNYLTNEYPNICEYNKANSDFPLSYNIIIINFDYLLLSDEQYLSLIKLFKHGRNAGVLFFSLFNEQSFAEEIIESREKKSFTTKHRIKLLELILQKSVTIYKSKDKYTIRNTNEKLITALNQFDFFPDCNDVEGIVNSILEKVEKNKKESNVKDFISVPIGKKGRHTYYFELGLKSTSYHAFIGGETGMGKSNFINNIIVQIAEKYSPDDIRLTLLDLKGAGGTEFQFYKEHPNVETLVLTSRLDIVEKVIKDFVNELAIRTKLFNENGVKSIEEYRKKTGKKLPYKLMIIDEVQELFTTDWKTKNLFNSLLDKIGRQGRSYGVHMILSTQSLTDVDISNSILNNLKLRISFKLSNLNDCRKIMDARGTNELPYDIEPYEVVYNNNLGKPESNQHFLTTEIKTDTIIKRLRKVKHKKTLPFQRKIYTFDSKINELNNKVNGNEIKKINSNLKSEINLDDY